MPAERARSPLEGEHALRDEAATRALGAALAGELTGGELIALHGELGAGKTSLVRGLAAGLGLDERVVTSPTFALHHRYEGGRLRLDHVDAYRLAGPADLDALDLLADHSQRAVLVVEWAARVAAALPAPSWEVTLSVAGLARRVVVRRGVTPVTG